jgi:hypothetical protein
VRSIRHIAALVAVAAAGLGLAACGSSGKPADASASSKLSSGLRFAECMRSHGVQNFPDPTTSSGGGVQIQQSQSNGSAPLTKVNGVGVSSPAFQSAMQTCQKDLPNGGHPTAAQTARAKAQALAMSACMRSHGVPNFPDPTFRSGPGGGTSIGIQLNPSSGVNPQSPAFLAAQKVCMKPGSGFATKALPASGAGKP